MIESQLSQQNLRHAELVSVYPATLKRVQSNDRVQGVDWVQNGYIMHDDGVVL